MIPAVMSKGVVKSGMLIDDDTEVTSPYHIDHDDRGRGESTLPRRTTLTTMREGAEREMVRRIITADTAREVEEEGPG